MYKSNLFPAEGVGALTGPPAQPGTTGAYGAHGFTSRRGERGVPFSPGRYEFDLDPAAEAQLGAEYASGMGLVDAERGALQDYIASLEGAEQRGRAGIMSGLGRGVSGAFGGAGGRVSAAAMRQAGLEGGQALSQFETQTIPEIELARAEGFAKLKTVEDKERERKAIAKQAFMDSVQGIKNKYSNFFETDTRLVAGEILAMANAEPDPELRAFMISEAERIRSTPSNLFTIA